MCRSAHQPGGRHRTRFRRAALACATLCLALPLAAHAQGDPAAVTRPASPAPKSAPRSAPTSVPADATQQVTGGVIDVTGLMDRPRGDARLPWAAPEGFAREPDVTFGRALQDEILTPVDRNDLRRLLELERALGR
jgi:hypothetical protein